MIKLTADIIESFTQTLLATSFDTPVQTPEFHKELWALCCSDSPLVAIAAPRGHAKSTAITLSYVMATLLFRQKKFCLLISDTEGQAVMFLNDIKQHLESNENLRALFNVKGFIKSTESDLICEMSDGHKFRIIAKGSEQKVRGTKWDNLRPDLIVGDDLENDEIVMNQERRDKFKRWFFGALLPCRSHNGIVRIVGTILHMDSMLNRLMPQSWGKNTRKEGLKTFDINPKKAWDSVLYEAHDEDFEHVLWPDRWSEAKLRLEQQRLKELGYPELYAQEFLNRPLDEANAFFRKTDFVGISAEEKDNIEKKTMPLNYYLGVDLAISEKERADWSVFTVAGVNALNQLYIVDVVRARMDGREIVDTLIQLQQRYSLQFVAIEDEKISKSLGPFIREAMQKTGIYISLVPIVPSADKKTRARSIQARMRIGSVKFNKDAEWYPPFEAELTRFPRDVHDDRVDSLALIGLALDKIAVAQTLEEIAEDEYENEKVLHMSSGRSSYTGY